MTASPVYVLDSPALVELGAKFDGQPSRFEALTNLVDEQRLFFALAVRDECQKICREETVWVWAKASYSKFGKSVEVPYDFCSSVLDVRRDLLDIDAADDLGSPVATAALALHLQEDGPVIVVSADESEILDRCTLPEACDDLGLECCSVDEFLGQVDFNLLAAV